MSETSNPARHARDKSAAFDAAELFSHGIELIDIRPGRAQVPRDRHLVFERDAFDRGGQQSRAAAGKQAKTKIVRAERFDDPQNLPRAENAFRPRFVDAGRPRGVQMDAFQRSDAIGRHVDPAGELFFAADFRPEDFFDRLGHARPRLARSHHGDPAHGPQIDFFIADQQQLPVNLEAFFHQPFRAHGLDARLPNPQCIAS